MKTNKDIITGDSRIAGLARMRKLTISLGMRTREERQHSAMKAVDTNRQNKSKITLPTLSILKDE